MSSPEHRFFESDLQLKDASAIFRKYVRFLRQPDPGAVLDTGCRGGQVTVEILRKFYEENFMVGIDADNELIQYAKDRSTDVWYTTTNITDSEQVINMEHRTTFNQIFSFSSLYWINEPNAALKHMEFLLAENGQLVLGFVACSPVYSTYRKLAENPKWGRYMEDYYTWLPFTYSWNQPDIPLVTLMSDAGFQILRTMTFHRYFSSLGDLEQHVWDVNPFIRRIPKEEQCEFIRDCMDITKRQQTSPAFLYTVVSAQAQKAPN